MRAILILGTPSIAGAIAREFALRTDDAVFVVDSEPERIQIELQPLPEMVIVPREVDVRPSIVLLREPTDPLNRPCSAPRVLGTKGLLLKQPTFRRRGSRYP